MFCPQKPQLYNWHKTLHREPICSTWELHLSFQTQNRNKFYQGRLSTWMLASVNDALLNAWPKLPRRSAILLYQHERSQHVNLLELPGTASGLMDRTKQPPPQPLHSLITAENPMTMPNTSSDSWLPFSKRWIMAWMPLWIIWFRSFA